MNVAGRVPRVNRILDRFIDGDVDAAAIVPRVHFRGAVRP
jgi:hypothetical protein